MAAAKDCHAMSSYYAAKYEEHYGKKPVLNRNKARWGWDGILMDYSIHEARELVDYYFETPNNKNHSIDWFLNNYDVLVEGMQRTEEERNRKAMLMEESKKRVEDWRASGRSGIELN